MKTKNMGMSLMCLACCAVPLYSIIVGSGIFASLVLFLGSHGGIRALGIVLGFSLIGAAGFSIWRRDRAKKCCN